MSIDAQLAERLKARCNYVNRSHVGAFFKGSEAALDGKPKSACPYNSRATAIVGGGRHIPTGERGFANAWLAGWDAAKELPPPIPEPPKEE